MHTWHPDRSEQKHFQLLFSQKCEVSTVSAAGFQQVLFIPFTHRVKAEEQKTEDRVLQVSWCQSKNYTERKQTRDEEGVDSTYYANGTFIYHTTGLT